MSETLVVIGVVNVISVLYYFFVICRVTEYIRPCSFHETRETKLIGLITIRHVFIAYFLCIVLSMLVQAYTFFRYL